LSFCNAFSPPMSVLELEPTWVCWVVPDEAVIVVVDTVVLSSATLFCPVETPPVPVGVAF
jgi:hypothetical protein